MRAHLLLALLVVAAGCADAPRDADDDVTVPERPLAFVLGEPVQVAPVPNNQVEAALSVSADGRTLLTCFHGLFQETSPGYASTDGGATWTRMAFPATAGVGGDCETAVTDGGAWAFLASTVAGATVLVSEDNGTTWRVNPVTAIPVNGLADRPWLEAVGDELWLAYMPLNFQPGTVGFTKSADLGATWTAPVLVGTPGPGTTSVRHGHFAIDDGTVWFPLVRYVGLSPLGERFVQVAGTTDGGATWSVEDLHHGSDVWADWPSLARTEAGDLLLAFTAAAPSGNGGTFALHRPPGGAWSAPFLLHDPDGGSATWPWIAGGNGHNATFVVDGGAHEGTSHLWVGRVDAATAPPTVQTWPVWPEPGVEFASVDHAADGTAYVAWVDGNDAQYVVRGALMPV